MICSMLRCCNEMMDGDSDNRNDVLKVSSVVMNEELFARI